VKHDQSAVFVALHSYNNRVFTGNQIDKAQKKINMTQEKGSTTVYQSFIRKHLNHHWQFWNLPFPVSITNFPQRGLLD
jgi:hypothetical protein